MSNEVNEMKAFLLDVMVRGRDAVHKDTYRYSNKAVVNDYVKLTNYNHKTGLYDWHLTDKGLAYVKRS